MTGENSGPVLRRAEKLRIEKVFLGVKDKLSVMKQFPQENNLSFDEIAYIGDDMNDLEVIQHAGVTACPADAVNEIKGNVDYIADNQGGFGAFRDFCEYIILQLNKD
jgi:YrbI family 3-deoxy-D-manno-octulosonate 8-phosphate phosphatase